MLITPTPLGRTVYGPLEKLARQRNSAIIAGLSDEELDVLDRCIAVMTANSRAQLAHEEGLQEEVDGPHG